MISGKLKQKRELHEIYQLEEFMAEKRINRVSLPIILLFDAALIILPFITSTKYTNPNLLSNFTGMTIFSIYHVINFILLKKERNSWIRKYLTMFFSVTIITIVTIGYHYGTGYVHSTRTVTVTAYFLAIILSGQYQNPGICLFTAILVSVEYTLHFLLAYLSGQPILLAMESFRENILTWDILYVYLLFFTVAGILMYLNSRGHHKLMIELRNSTQKAEYFENYDELTDLPNLKFFKEKTETQARIAGSRNQNFTVLCLGIDGFIKLNQLYGVKGGDDLLIQIGKRLKKTYRDDDFLCRYMGDKFLVLFPNMKSFDNISNLIRKSKKAFSEPFILESNRVKLTASGGFSSYPLDTDSYEALIENAETAMYEAKQAGKNSFRLFDLKRQTELEQQIILEKALEEALEKKEFYLVYQPKVDITGKITGMECLIRWQHPELGSVSPEKFIPIAEKSGEIISIGYFVLEECCRMIKRWTELGMHARRITVNVSPFQFLHSGFISDLEQIIRKYSINPRWLGIELTESGMMIEEGECIDKLTRIKALGLTISIDDFGKGYSSLSRLGNYPVDTLKIDKSFVDDLPHSSTSACLVRSIIDLAHNLNYHVIAEGVETKEQVDFLVANGCTHFQGYYYYKPLSAEEVESLLIRD